MSRPNNRPNALGVRVGDLDYERLLFLAKISDKPISTISSELLVQAARDRIRQQIEADEAAEKASAENAVATLDDVRAI